MNRDELRQKAFNSKPAKRIQFEYEGATFELMSPTVAVRKEIFNKSNAGLNKAPTLLDMQEWVAIYCVVVPGTNQLIFEDTDFGTFENMNMGGFLDAVGEHVYELLNVSSEKELPKDGGSSEETTSQGS